MLILQIAGETKFIDTIKYYQKSLGQLAATLSVNEELTVKILQNKGHMIIFQKFGNT